MTEDAAPKMIVVKFRAAEDQQSLYAAGLFIFDLARATHAKLRVAASGSRHLMEINISATWKSFEGAIISGQVADSSASFLAEDIKGSLQSAIDNPLSEFHAMLRSDDLSCDVIAPHIGLMISKCMGVESTIAEVKVEKLSAEDSAMLGGASQEPAVADAPGDKEVKRANVYLAMKLEVSPIKGVRIKNLKIGAEVYATLLDIGNYIRYFPGRTDQNPMLTGTVVSLDLSSPREAKVLVKLDEGIYGKMLLHPDVMVKTSVSDSARSSSAALMVAMLLMGLFILGLGVWMLMNQ